MKRIKIGENEKEILRMVATGAFILSSIAIPNLPVALRPFFKSRGEKGFRKVIKKLKTKGAIQLSGDEVFLTPKGKKLLKIIQLQEIEIERPRKWDKTWRLVAYDIPEEFKKERDWFRYLLEKLDFYQIQKSLWVYPFDCREEIAIMALDLKISNFVIYMQTDHLPRQWKIERHFHLIEEK